MVKVTDFEIATCMAFGLQIYMLSLVLALAGGIRKPLLIYSYVAFLYSGKIVTLRYSVQFPYE